MPRVRNEYFFMNERADPFIKQAEIFRLKEIPFWIRGRRDILNTHVKKKNCLLYSRAK